jgi:8-oxo-dGTP pyrophosphatase MutT (NUDIX family)
MDNEIKTERTLCLLVNRSKILLGVGQRGFSLGKYNGFGGKLETGETIEQAAIRETYEESGHGVTIKKRNLNERAVIDFYFPKKPESNQRVHIYMVHIWKGKPFHSGEMKNFKYFNFNDLPKEDMLDSDRYWLPMVLDGKRFNAEVYWKDDNKTVKKFIITKVFDT